MTIPLTLNDDRSRAIWANVERVAARVQQWPAWKRRGPTGVPKGATCTHPRMRECHRGCGHYSCPDCGLEWDDHAEK